MPHEYHISEHDLPLGWEAIAECDDEHEAISVCVRLARDGFLARFTSLCVVWVMKSHAWPPSEAFCHHQSIKKYLQS